MKDKGWIFIIPPHHPSEASCRWHKTASETRIQTRLKGPEQILTSQSVYYGILQNRSSVHSVLFIGFVG